MQCLNHFFGQKVSSFCITFVSLRKIQRAALKKISIVTTTGFPNESGCNQELRRNKQRGTWCIFQFRKFSATFLLFFFSFSLHFRAASVFFSSTSYVFFFTQRYRNRCLVKFHGNTIFQNDFKRHQKRPCGQKLTDRNETFFEGIQTCFAVFKSFLRVCLAYGGRNFAAFSQLKVCISTPVCGCRNWLALVLIGRTNREISKTNDEVTIGMRLISCG